MLATKAKKATTQKIHWARISFNSATNGAQIVAILEKILQAPYDVDNITVGNSNTFPRYAMLKEEAIPNLDPRMKIEIQN